MKTGLRIRVLEGQTVDGRTEYEFPASSSQPEERIVIGRDPDHCRIVFVDDLRHHGLGNEHMALRRSLGRYQLDLNTQNSVLMDGNRTFEEKELRGTHELRLGDAVRLEVTVVDDRTATQRDTDIEQPQQVTLRNRKLLAGLAAAVAVLAVGGWWLNKQQKQIQDKADAVAKAVGESNVPADALERAARAVYLIVAKSDEGGESAIGTGWSAPGGVIVTNAHIAKNIPNSPDTVHWLVRSATPPYREHAVRAHRIHPGFEAFQTFVGSIKPVQETIDFYEEVGLGLACDVAVLEVEDADALADPLEIRPREELKTLAAGDPVAIVGFPSEGLASTPVLTSAPVPVRHRGFLVRVTDFFMRQREDGMNQFVQHGLPVTGGSSGSPIIDSRGRVIAVHNGGNTLASTDNGRIISLVVNYSQRADLVLDLLEHAEAERLADYRQMWAASLADFQRASDIRMAEHFRHTASVVGRGDARPRIREELPGQAIVCKNGEDLRRAVPVELKLEPGVYTLRVGAVDPDNVADLDVIVLDAFGNEVERDESLSVIGLSTVINLHPQVYRLIGWVQNAEGPVAYSCTVHDWQCDAEEYLSSEVARALARHLDADEPPDFDLRTKGVQLAGDPGSARRCTIEARIPKPGIYAAIGRASAPVAFAMTLSDGGRSLEASTTPASAESDPTLSQSPIVIFKVENENALLRFVCESVAAEDADGAVQIENRILGWTGTDLP